MFMSFLAHYFAESGATGVSAKVVAPAIYYEDHHSPTPTRLWTPVELSPIGVGVTNGTPEHGKISDLPPIDLN